MLFDTRFFFRPPSNGNIMFLQSSRKLKFNADLEDITARSLNIRLLGDYVGNAWGVGREFVWAPSISKHLKVEGHLPGLYKVQGETVQAIMGAIYHQFVRAFPVLSSSFAHSP